METGPHTRGPSAIRPSGQAWYSHRTGARRGRPDVRYAKLDMEANGCVLHSGHHKILCPWATRGRYQWWRPEGYLSQAHTQVEANGAEMKYAVVFEKAANNWCAYVPDLPGCVTTGQTPQHTRRMIEEAIEFHIEGLRLRGEPVPEPSAIVDNVEVQAA